MKMELTKTAEGKKFFKVDIPQLIKQLTRLADAAEKFNISETKKFEVGVAEEVKPAFGTFEEITKDEVADILALSKDFDKWFERMDKNLNLSKVFPLEEEFRLVKNIARHAYNANKP